MNRLKVNIICILITLLIVFNLGCINNNETDNNSKMNITKYTYLINIETDDNNDYEIYFPIAIYSNNSVSNIMHNLKFSNENVISEIIITPYGKALKIVGKGAVYIQSTISGYDLSFPKGTDRNHFPNDSIGFSMWNNTIENENSFVIGYVWVYCNSSLHNETIITYFSILREKGGNGLHHNVELIELKHGWNRYPVEVERVVV